MNVNHQAKTVNMFVYDSQKNQPRLLPPLFLVLSADQIPDSATAADPKCCRVGSI